MLSPCDLGQNGIFASEPALFADEIGKFRSILSIPGDVKLACPYEQRTT